MTRFQFSRDDYPTQLGTYLETAQRSIHIVSVSLKVTDQVNDLVGVFRRKLRGDGKFTIDISILHPDCPAAGLAAEALDATPADLETEIRQMMTDLLDLRDSLPKTVARRLTISVHRCLPMGSVVMLDADGLHGAIQVETKLHRAPRSHSFGFEVVGPSQFFSRQHESWLKVFEESDPANRSHGLKHDT
jgi:hypothetical protein